MDPLTKLDGNVLIGIQQLLNADWLTPIFKFITWLGEDGIVFITVCLLLIIFRKTRRLGIICSLSLALSFICCNLILKPLVDRPRPWELYEAVQPMLPDPGDESFPSGHTTNAMGLAWAMFINTLPVREKIVNEETGKTRVLKNYEKTPCLGWNGCGADPAIMHKLGIIAVIVALLIGLSRLYLGMHFPSDVVCGALIGMICACIINIIVTKIESKHGIIGKKKV